MATKNVTAWVWPGGPLSRPKDSTSPKQLLFSYWFQSNDYIQQGTWKTLLLLQLRHHCTFAGHQLGLAWWAAESEKQCVDELVVVTTKLANFSCITFNCIDTTQEEMKIRLHLGSHVSSLRTFKTISALHFGWIKMKDDDFNALIGASDGLILCVLHRSYTIDPGKACSFSNQHLMKNCVPCAFKTINQDLMRTNLTPVWPKRFD